MNISLCAQKRALRAQRKRCNGTKKRGRSIASVTVSIAVPCSSGLGGIFARTSLTSVPFNPDICPVFSSSEVAAANAVAPVIECDIHNKQNTHERIENPSRFRAVAQHRVVSCCFENFPTECTPLRPLEPSLSGSTASSKPIEFVVHHVCPTVSMPYVTGLRQGAAAGLTDIFSYEAVK